MSDLLALLSQQASSSSSLRSRKALIVLGLQNDFVTSAGKLPIPDTEFVDRLAKLVPEFREFGDVVWIRNISESSPPSKTAMPEGETVVPDGNASCSTSARRPKKSPPTAVDRLDLELFLDSSAAGRRCCVRDTPGARWDDRVQSLQQAHDLRLDSLHYSAFAKTSLLFTLRAKLITELYICGCFTNVSIYATAMDAARYGIQTTLVEDCLGYRHRDRHDLALQQLHDIMRARAVPASRVIETLRDPSTAESWSDPDEDGDFENEDGDDTDPDDESSYGEESSDDDNCEPPTNTNVRSGLGPITAADIEADSEASDDEECMPTLNIDTLLSRNRLVLQTSQLRISSPKLRKRQLEVNEPGGKGPKAPTSRNPQRGPVSPHSREF
ncbi:Isochorismatase hydrolase [Dissoconium aciculare CBS 342.82]|uniref:Isochorismatase hydrolase n=1 Tax=Dissoconium aciculare CBS 342.82 TaxID=1314786 RepID=A0A6J3MCQ9_9PEZI|nr:Isochorismatase hydrolase [Dissoconium aciculare CBS 342.82]KAF1825379.1 Isochorismatase hydrolase [Dissoconium aciculare CBS 342.82]